MRYLEQGWGGESYYYVKSAEIGENEQNIKKKNNLGLYFCVEVVAVDPSSLVLQTGSCEHQESRAGLQPRLASEFYFNPTRQMQSQEKSSKLAAKQWAELYWPKIDAEKLLCDNCRRFMCCILNICCRMSRR